MERHVSLPDLEDGARVLSDDIVPIDEHPAESSAQDDAERCKEDQVIDIVRSPGGTGLRRTPSCQPPGSDEPDEIHDSVPVDLDRAVAEEWPDGERHGVEGRI